MVIEGLELAPHHAESIANVVRAFEADATTRAVMLGGSLAHGYARPDSDIDVMIVVDASRLPSACEGRSTRARDRTLCTYEGGYVDCKYLDVDFLARVAAHGSDPARYAFRDARILSSRIDGLPQLVAAAARYPVEETPDRMTRFTAQLLAWRWYFGESARLRRPIPGGGRAPQGRPVRVPAGARGERTPLPLSQVAAPGGSARTTPPVRLPGAHRLRAGRAYGSARGCTVHGNPRVLRHR